MSPPDPATMLGGLIALTPTALVGALGFACLSDRRPAERWTSRIVATANTICLLATVALGALLAFRGQSSLDLVVGDWVHLPGYHFTIKLLFDRHSLPFALLAFLLCALVGLFADRYMHREPGYNRFFFLYSLFVCGMTFTAIAGTIETLFFGWELVGLSSTLLVAFFHERPMPVRNGLRVWSVYRVSDAALLLAAVALHHLADQGDFVALIRHQSETGSALNASQATLVGGLLLLAAAGKSALVPFSGWLPRAMEGPTPSSAVFYGAISVHLGAYLLIRSAPILEAGVMLEWVVVGLGLATALFGAVCGRVQTDIKGALSFASMTQVGLIVAEIGMGWHTLAMVHLCGHACLRTLQFLRAPSLLADYRTMENATGSGAADHGDPAEGGFGRALYRFAIERGWLDALLHKAVVGPILNLFRAADRLERRLTDLLHGRSAPIAPEPEDLA